MKKFLLILLFIALTPMLSLVAFNHQDYQYYPITADSGFDSDYGGGGSWGGGSSWGDDYSSDGGSYGSNNNYDYSSNSGGSADPMFTICLVAGVGVFIGFILLINYFNDKDNRYTEAKKRIDHSLFSSFGITSGCGADDDLVQSAYTNYVEIQKAWMNRDLSPVRHLLTDEMYNMYQMQIETLIEDNQMNVMSDFIFNGGYVDSIESNKNCETINIILCVKCKDYIKSTKNNTVVNGDKKATMIYVYELTFVRDLKKKKRINCPACGAEIKDQMSSICPYCNNTLHSTSSNITLSNKVMLEQYKLKY